MYTFEDFPDATGFGQRLRMMIQHDREQDERRELRRGEQQRLRTHAPNRKNKRAQSKKSRRANR